MTLQELREQRERLIAQANEIVGANNEIEPSRREEFDRIMGELGTNREALEAAQRVEDFRAIERQTLPSTQESRPSGEGGDREREGEGGEERYSQALSQYLRRGLRRMDGESREILEQGYVSFGDEARDMATLSGADGGFVVAPDTRFYGVILNALKFFGGMEAVGSEVITTETGADLPYPVSDDTANVGTIIAEEGSHASGTTPTIGQRILKAHLYSSKTLKVSWQFIQDAAIDVEGWLGARLGERLGRIQNTHFTVGDAVSKPQGIMPAATVGRTTATGFTTSIEFDDVYRLIHSVDVAYRNERSRFMFHDDTALQLRLAKDGNGRYLWPEMGSVQSGQPVTLAGHPITINNDVAQMAANALSMSFGDHNAYKIRRVAAMQVVRLDELFVENGQVGFLAFMRADGGYINSGDPVKTLKHASS